MQNVHAETSQPTVQSRGDRVKSTTSRGCAKGRPAREESRDVVMGGESVARLVFWFKIDKHPTKMMVKELELIRDLY